MIFDILSRARFAFRGDALGLGPRNTPDVPLAKASAARFLRFLKTINQNTPKDPAIPCIVDNDATHKYATSRLLGKTRPGEDHAPFRFDLGQSYLLSHWRRMRQMRHPSQVQCAKPA
jgi:hypothetical protein